MTAINNHNNQNLNLPPPSKSWCAKSCSIRPGAILGSALMITAVALAVLQKLYGFDFSTGTVWAGGLGISVFVLDSLSIGCSKLMKMAPDTVQSLQKSQSTQKTAHKTTQPLPKDMETRQFFESKGVFGVPQELIDEITIWRHYRLDPDFDFNLEAGFLLYGPPGNGKTTIAALIAELLGGEFSETSCGDLKSHLHGRTEKNMSEIFNVPENSFRVIFLDEINGLLNKRTGDSNLRNQDGIVSHFLSIVNGQTQKKPRFILIGATNRVNELDEAVVRAGRLGKKIHINNPTMETRQQIFSYYQQTLPMSENEDWSKFAEEMAQQTNNHSCADLEGIKRDAQKKAFLENRKTLNRSDFGLSDDLS